MQDYNFDSYFDEPLVRFRVEDLCQEKGISMSQLASSLRMPVSNLKRLFVGNPTINSLVRVAKVLRVALPDLIDDN